MNAVERILNLILPAGASVSALALIVWYLRGYFKPLWGDGGGVAPLPGRCDSGFGGNLRLIGWIAAWVLASRLFLYVIALIGCAATGQAREYLMHPQNYWVRWDAHHYLGLARDWYVNEGDPRFHIVFYPLYPLLVRMALPLFAQNVMAAALCVSNLCLTVACWALYHIARMQFDDGGARYAVRALLLFPTSLFLSIPYSESTFLMLTLLAVLAARREKLWLAVFFGALASASRIQGLLTAVPVFYEAMRLSARRGRISPARIALRALQTSLIAAGFGAYLLLNWQVTGNALQFLIYQREHWGQTLGSVWNTLSYTIENAFYYDSLSARLGIWIPQFVAIAAAFGLMWATIRRAHPADGAYALLYAWISFSPTWLLSGPRYLMAMYSLYPMLASLVRGRRRWGGGAVLAVLIAGTVYCVVAYAVFGGLL
jgi:hypothetical protein